MSDELTIVGMGGLGNHVLLTMASLGVKNIHIVDFDKVEEKNLNRQPIFTSNDVGRYKVEVAAERVNEIFKAVNVNPILEKISGTNTHLLSAPVAVCTDNMESRYAINDHCVVRGLPMFFGFVGASSGMAMTVLPGSANLRDLSPMKDVKQQPSLTAVAVIAAAQSREAYNYLNGKECALVNKLLSFNAKDSTFERHTVKKK